MIQVFGSALEEGVKQSERRSYSTSATIAAIAAIATAARKSDRDIAAKLCHDAIVVGILFRGCLCLIDVCSSCSME